MAQLSLSPACRSMFLSVPIGKSLAGCFTVTLPGLVGCLNWWCDPFTFTSCQPSASKRLMISRECIRQGVSGEGKLARYNLHVKLYLAIGT